jgi:tRNA A-37 threonylcarbamoyl transferase component Bud32
MSWFKKSGTGKGSSKNQPNAGAAGAGASSTGATTAAPPATPPSTTLSAGVPPPLTTTTITAASLVVPVVAPRVSFNESTIKYTDEEAENFTPGEIMQMESLRRFKPKHLVRLGNTQLAVLVAQEKITPETSDIVNDFREAEEARQAEAERANQEAAARMEAEEARQAEAERANQEAARADGAEERAEAEATGAKRSREMLEAAEDYFNFKLGIFRELMVKYGSLPRLSDKQDKKRPKFTSCSETDDMVTILTSEIGKMILLFKMINQIFRADPGFIAQFISSDGTVPKASNAVASSTKHRSKSPTSRSSKAKSKFPEPEIETPVDIAFMLANDESKRKEIEDKFNSLESNANASSGAASSASTSPMSDNRKTATGIWYSCKFKKFLSGEKNHKDAINYIIDKFMVYKTFLPVKFDAFTDENGLSEQFKRVWETIGELFVNLNDDFRKLTDNDFNKLPGGENLKTLQEVLLVTKKEEWTKGSIASGGGAAATAAPGGGAASASSDAASGGEGTATATPGGGATSASSNGATAVTDGGKGQKNTHAGIANGGKGQKNTHAGIANGSKGPTDLLVGLLMRGEEIPHQFVLEYKMLGKFPTPLAAAKTGELSKDDFNDLVLAPNVVKYMEHDVYTARTKRCPIRQTRGYCLMKGSKYGMISTIEKTVFTYIDETDPYHSIFLTNTFEGTDGKPFSGTSFKEEKGCICGKCTLDKDFESLMEEAASWPMWVILLRYLLAIALKNDDKLGPVPLFIKIFLKTAQGNDNETQGQDNASSNNGSGPGKTSSNNGSGQSNNNNSSIRSTKNGGGPMNSFVFHAPCLADLLDKRRLEHYYFEPLDGDAKLLSESRTGPVLRQFVQGWDTVFKLLYLTRPRVIDGEFVDPLKIREELLQEKRVYQKLQSLQGRIIPLFLWYGELVRGKTIVFVTEYSGSSLPEKLNKTQVASAKTALNKIHAEGVLHGDVELRNFLLKKDTMDEIVVIDFAFSSFREEFGDYEWETAVKKECQQLDSLLKDCYEREEEKMEMADVEVTVTSEVVEVKEESEEDEENADVEITATPKVVEVEEEDKKPSTRKRQFEEEDTVPPISRTPEAMAENDHVSEL